MARRCGCLGKIKNAECSCSCFECGLGRRCTETIYYDSDMCDNC